MKLKHPTHDPKPMDALSYYLQVQREYALAREGYYHQCHPSLYV